MNVSKVAQVTGVCRNVVSNAKKGKLINYEAGRKIAEFLINQ